MGVITLSAFRTLAFEAIFGTLNRSITTRSPPASTMAAGRFGM